MNVLLVGSGGREHALAWKIAQSALLDELHAAPGNPGISRLARCHPVAATDADALAALCSRHSIDLVVVGPEAPLVAGVGDRLRQAGVAVFGPGAEAARIEGSKSFAKEVMRAAGVPTPAELGKLRAPCVVKADGLAAGKGAFVCATQREAEEAWRRARALGERVVVEELLEGEELSLLVLAGGTDVLPLPPARDFKRLGDGDQGPNTGGMGAYAPVPSLSSAEVDRLVDLVHRPVLTELAARGMPFTGVLYAGLMLTEDGPRVLEFNCRFGDPETQASVPLLQGDLLAALAAAATGDLEGVDLAASPRAAVAVVLASPGYPARPETGSEIRGVEAAEASGALVFHSGTAALRGSLLSSGGRVLTVTGLGTSLDEARARAYRGVGAIDLPGAQYRRDIAREAARPSAATFPLVGAARG